MRVRKGDTDFFFFFFFISAVATKIPRRYKLFIIVLYLSAGGVFVLFNLMLLKIVPKAMWGLGLCISIGSLLMGAGNVLFYELAVVMTNL